MSDVYEDIRAGADDAWRKIDRNPERINELNDDDLMSLATQVKTALPILEAVLVGCCDGDVQRANAAITRVFGFPQGKIIKTIRCAHIARIAERPLSENQCAALVLDTKAGVGAVMVELERRAARRSGRMN